MKSLLLSDTFGLRKSSTISKRKGSDELSPIPPGTTRGKTTARQDFFFSGRLQGRNLAEQQRHPQTARDKTAGRIHRHICLALWRGQFLPGNRQQSGTGISEECSIRVPVEPPVLLAEVVAGPGGDGSPRFMEVLTSEQRAQVLIAYAAHEWAATARPAGKICPGKALDLFLASG